MVAGILGTEFLILDFEILYNLQNRDGHPVFRFKINTVTGNMDVQP